MSSRDQKMQHFIREWMRETGNTDIDMHKVAKYAESKGFVPPKVPTAIDLLARDFARVAREQTRTDETTGRPYRVYHAFKQPQGNAQLTLWIDIDVAPRNKMWKSLQMRREQMVGDGYQLTLDADHWNGRNPGEEPIAIPLDFTEDVEWRKNTPDDDVDVG